MPHEVHMYGCDFCDYKHTSRSVVVMHEDSCPNNPDNNDKLLELDENKEITESDSKQIK